MRARVRAQKQLIMRVEFIDSECQLNPNTWPPGARSLRPSTTIAKISRDYAFCTFFFVYRSRCQGMPRTSYCESSCLVCQLKSPKILANSCQFHQDSTGHSRTPLHHTSPLASRPNPVEGGTTQLLVTVRNATRGGLQFITQREVSG